MGHVRQGDVVAQLGNEPAEEVAAVLELVKSSVPSKRPAPDDVEAIADRVGRQYARVGERLAVVHGERVAIEEVIGSLDDFVTDCGVEMASFDG